MRGGHQRIRIYFAVEGIEEYDFSTEQLMNRESIKRSVLDDIYARVLRLLKRRPEPQQPEDPYSYVTASKRPRPSPRSAAATAVPEE